MRILILIDPQSCFLSHTILTGLWEIGFDVDLYEMPILQSVRGRADEGYDLPGQPGKGMTGCVGYLSPNVLPEQIHTVEEILDLGENAFDLTICLSQRDYVRRSLKTLTDNGWKLDKLVACDGEDGTWVDREFLKTWKPRVLFKRELSREYAISSYESAYGLPTMPIQFGAFVRSIPEINDEEKTLDFFVSLGRTNPIRDKFLAACLDAVYDKGVCHPDDAWLATNSNSPLFTEHKYGSELHNLTPWSEYMALQGHAKIGASLVGFGNDCLHSWELFSFATFVLYQDTGLHIPYPFIDEEHCLYISEGDFLRIDQLIGSILKHDKKRERIARAGRDHCRTYHSTKARARYLIDVSMKVLGGEKLILGDYGL